MYAIIETGSKQYKVAVGDVVEVEKLGLENGAEVTFDKVLAVADAEGKLNIGTPVVEGAKVTAKVLDTFRAKKIVVFKMKRRKSYRRTHGHRQDQYQVGHALHLIGQHRQIRLRHCDEQAHQKSNAAKEPNIFTLG